MVGGHLTLEHPTDIFTIVSYIQICPIGEYQLNPYNIQTGIYLLLDISRLSLVVNVNVTLKHTNIYIYLLQGTLLFGLVVNINMNPIIYNQVYLLPGISIFVPALNVSMNPRKYKQSTYCYLYPDLFQQSIST